MNPNISKTTQKNIRYAENILYHLDRGIGYLMRQDVVITHHQQTINVPSGGAWLPVNPDMYKPEHLVHTANDYGFTPQSELHPVCKLIGSHITGVYEAQSQLKHLIETWKELNGGY